MITTGFHFQLRNKVLSLKVLYRNDMMLLLLGGCLCKYFADQRDFIQIGLEESSLSMRRKLEHYYLVDLMEWAHSLVKLNLLTISREQEGGVDRDAASCNAPCRFIFISFKLEHCTQMK